MATKNLVPRADGEGKLGLKQAGNDRRWSEVNAVSGSFSHAKIDVLVNTDGSPLFVAGTNITINPEEGPSGYQYKISSTASGGAVDADKIIEGDTSVEAIDTGSDGHIVFKTDNNERWHIEQLGHIVPQADAAYNIGESSKKVNSIHLSDANGIIFASGNITADTSTKRLKYTHSTVDNVLPLTKVVRAATTSELTGFTYNAGVFTEDSSSGALTLDTNVVLVDGDRVLVKNQATSAQNGIYVVANVDGSSAVTLSRANDFATSQSFANIIVNVREGSSNGGNLYHSLLASNGDSVIGTTNQLWAQINNEGITFGSLIDINADLEDTDKFIVDDGGNGTTRESQLLRLKKYIFSAISGDATATVGGDLTIATGAVDNSMLDNSSLTFSDGTNSSAVDLGGTLTIQGTANEVEVVESSGTFTVGLPATTTITTSLSVPTIKLTGQNADLALNSKRITNLGAPQELTDAATKAYVDSVAQGLTINNAVRAATTEPLTLATDFEDGDPLDGITLATGDRILIKDQTTASENGIYIVQASGAPLRAADMAAASSAAGVFMFVQEGTDNGDKGFVCTSDSGSDVVGTNDLTFTQFSGAGQITAGKGLVLNGSAFDVKLASAGGLEIPNNELQISANGVTNAMLAGSISDSKLNQITAANKVALNSLDIDGGIQLVALDDADLFIVDDGANGTNKKMAASELKSYVLPGITGDATVNASGVLTIEPGAVEAGMLNNNIISGQVAIDTVDGASDFLLIHDGSAAGSEPAIKKVSVDSVISGLSVDNVDITDKAELTVSATDDALLISDVSDSGTNKKITAANLVTHQNLMSVVKVGNDTATTIERNSLVLLADGATSFNLTLSTTGAVEGDRIQIKADNVANYFAAKRISIDGVLYETSLFLNQGLEFVFITSSWVNNQKFEVVNESITTSTISLASSSVGGKQTKRHIVKAATNNVDIFLPSTSTINSLYLEDTTFEFFVGSSTIETITFACADQIILSNYGASNTTVTQKIINPQHFTTIIVTIRDTDGAGDFKYTIEYVEKNPEQVTELPESPSNESLLVYSGTNWVSSKLQNVNVADNADIALTKLQNVNPMRILGHVDGGDFTDAADSISQVKVYKSVTDLQTDVANADIGENSSLLTGDAIIDFINASASTSTVSSSPTYTYFNFTPSTSPGTVYEIQQSDFDGNGLASIVIKNSRPRNIGYDGTVKNYLMDSYVFNYVWEGTSGYNSTMGIELPRATPSEYRDTFNNTIKIYIISTLDYNGVYSAYKYSHIPPLIKTYPNKEENFFWQQDSLIPRFEEYKLDVSLLNGNETDLANVRSSMPNYSATGNYNNFMFYSSVINNGVEFYDTSKFYRYLSDADDGTLNANTINNYYKLRGIFDTRPSPTSFMAPYLGYHMNQNLAKSDAGSKCLLVTLKKVQENISSITSNNIKYQTRGYYWKIENTGIVEIPADIV